MSELILTEKQNIVSVANAIREKTGISTPLSLKTIIDLIEENYTGILDVEHGGTGYSTIEDTTYTTPRYRASSLYAKSSTETPSVNGVIYWFYE